MAMGEHLTISEAGGVVEILMDRPDKKNALTNAMYDALTAALAQAAEGAASAVVIGSTGPDFTAGNDLDDFTRAAEDGPPLRAFPFIEALAAFPKPLVAAVRGRGVGIGLTMLLHCDLVYVSEDARLSAPFAQLGLVPEAASSLLLPARIGHARAFEIFAMGRVLSGTEAVALGLANLAMSADEVAGAARAGAERLSALAPGAAGETKRLMRQGAALAAQMAEENRVFSERLVGDAAREAFAAFRARRAPDFSGLA